LVQQAYKKAFTQLMMAATSLKTPSNERAMLRIGEIDGFERQLRASIVALNKRGIRNITLIETIDEASLWPDPFDEMTPFVPSMDLDALIARAPLFICSIASEIGFLFEGIGTEYWGKFSNALGLDISLAQRAKIGEMFNRLASKYNISSPSESAFSEHFSIISWPIANALLPIDLVGPVARLLARAPVTALAQSRAQATNFASLRAWASAAEGARLVDWLRFEAPTARVLTALLTENRQAELSEASYSRLLKAIAIKPEAFFAARVARMRARSVKPILSVEQSRGRLTLGQDASRIRLYASWPALQTTLFDEARASARSAAWRPRLWGAGPMLHPDTALSSGPFALELHTVPADDDSAYSGAAEVFGVGSEVAAALAARTIDWNANLLFDPNDNGTQAEQRFDVLSGESEVVWIASRADGAALDGLRHIGDTSGYTVFEADLSNAGVREILLREGLLSNQSRSSLVRHPLDAIGAPQGVVRPDRPFLLYNAKNSSGEETKPQRLGSGERIGTISGLSGRSGLRAEVAAAPEGEAVDLILFERDAAFEALIERRLQLRVESRLPLTNVTLTSQLEIGRRIVACGHDRLSELPKTVPGNSPLLAPLYDDQVRSKLLEFGRGVLRIAIGRLTALNIEIERPAALVQWSDDTPQLIGSSFDTQLVVATAQHPNRFVPTAAIRSPERSAVIFGLRLADGRIVDRAQIFTSTTFNFGDLEASFGDSLGSRRMFDHDQGVGDLARARVSWSRGLCRSLPAIAAKTRIVRQFEDPLVISLCGRAWSLAERATLSEPSDPHIALWNIALKRDLATVPENIAESEEIIFARAFRNFAKHFDPSWPLSEKPSVDGAMDDALNAAFTEAVINLHEKGKLLDVDENDCDFGSVAEEWEDACAEAIRLVRRLPLAKLLVPSEGGLQLSGRYYGDLSIAELAEDLSAWTKIWALPRGQLSPETAANALLLWLSPASCDDVDAAVRVLVVDPFVSRASRYIALRFLTETVEASP
jgi:hypothetical protein